MVQGSGIDWFTVSAEWEQEGLKLTAADLERLKAVGDPGLAAVKLEVDPTFGPGDCRVSSELGIVDGRVSTRLAEIKEALEGDE